MKYNTKGCLIAYINSTNPHKNRKTLNTVPIQRPVERMTGNISLNRWTQQTYKEVSMTIKPFVIPFQICTKTLRVSSGQETSSCVSALVYFNMTIGVEKLMINHFNTYCVSTMVVQNSQLNCV